MISQRVQPIAGKALRAVEVTAELAKDLPEFAAQRTVMQAPA